MAVGDTVSSMSGVGSGNFFSIQATASQEWVIHNIYHGGGVNLQFYDGTNPMSFTSVAGANVETNLQFHVTNALYIRVQNTETTSQWVGYDGMQTK